jgi:hypothetical protein
MEAKVAAMNAKYEEQMKKGAEMLAAASEAEKGGIAATQAAEETALKQKLEREKAQMEMELVEGQLMEQRKLTEQKHAEEKELRRSQEAARQKEAEKSRIQYDLMDAIPACRQANSSAKELGFESLYEVKLISDQTPMGLKNEVCIQLSDSSGAQELWNIKKFRAKYGILMQQYYDNKANLEKGLPIELPVDSPFTVSHHALQVIGHAKIMLNYIFFNIEVDDKFHVVSYTGQIAGDVYVKITASWPKELEETVKDVDNLRELFDASKDKENSLFESAKSFTHLDLVVEVIRCSSLPAKFASDVRIEYSFPDFVANSMVPLDGNLPERADFEGDDQEYEDKYDVQRGGSQMTPFQAENEGKLNINPEIGYKRTVRIHDIGKKQIKWFETGELVMTVMGEIPDDMGTKQADAAASRAKTLTGAGMGDAGKDEEINRLRNELKAAKAGSTGGTGGTGGTNDESAKLTVELEKEKLATKAAEARATAALSGDMGQEVQKLQEKISQLEKEKASMKGGSGACSIL